MVIVAADSSTARSSQRLQDPCVAATSGSCLMVSVVSGLCSADLMGRCSGLATATALHNSPNAASIAI